MLLVRSISLSNFPNPPSLPTTPPNPPLLLRFRTSRHQNLRYLKSLGIFVNPGEAKHSKPPSPETLTRILSTVNFLKSKGFSESDFPRLSFLCPNLFSPHFEPSDLEPVFDFLSVDLAASADESRALILKCPHILESNAKFGLRPTLEFLRRLGVEELNSPTTLNAHLLDTRVERMEEKIGFLEGVGFSREESRRVCRRFPAIFGYGVEGNLRPKFEYLVRVMKRRGVEEVIRFPQYFGFSLGKRIVPRHLHLKQRNVEVPLNRMLLWSDTRFYAKWK